jgi:hypothetical protein
VQSERRRNKRLPGPYDGKWDGAAGLRPCRITDLSVTGCFIDSYATSPVGAMVTTEIRLGDELFLLESWVVYVDRVQGFAVRFADDNDPKVLKALAATIGALAAGGGQLARASADR